MGTFLLVVGALLFIGLVIVHEMGHFFAARRGGVDVEEFGVFFPPALWRKTMKGGWDLTLNLIPLGGFVKLKGEHDADKEKGSYGAASDWVKVRIMLAGVAMNLVTAVVLFFLLALVGIPHVVPQQFTVSSDARYLSRATYSVVAATVDPQSPAAKAGLKNDDRIVAIGPLAAGGDSSLKKVTEVTALQQYTKQYNGQTVRLQYERQGKPAEAQVTLRSTAETEKAARAGKPVGYLGVALVQDVKGTTVVRSTWSAPVVALGTTMQFTKLTLQGLWSAVQGLGGIVAGVFSGNQQARQAAQTEASSQVSGPLGIFFVLKNGSNMGLRFMLIIIALISLTLAIMNVLPIPALDGGRLFVMGLSRLFKTPISAKTEEAIYATGFLVLIGLVVIITVVDAKRFF